MLCPGRLALGPGGVGLPAGGGMVGREWTVGGIFSIMPPGLRGRVGFLEEEWSFVARLTN